MGTASSPEAGHWESVTASTLATVQQFNEATNRHEVDGMMACMTEDVVFESTLPPPDGERREGQAAVRTAWEELFRSSPQAAFETEEIFAAGGRCVVRWVYRWAPDEAGKPGHVRGVDIFRVRDAKVAEKLSYVKG